MLASKKQGFTLAEVLVTLAVIGVVAAMAIPALLGNTNQAELKTALKKAVSTMNQALIMSIAQDGVDASSCDTQTELVTMFKNKLNVISSGTDYIYTADGMKFTFNSPSTACGTSASNDISAADCYVTVDVNGDKNPNTLSTGASGTYAYKDQYYLIIKDKAVVPGTYSNYDVAAAALSN